MSLTALQRSTTGTWTVTDKDGQALAVFDTFFGCDYRGESKVASKPVEQGGFASYNKSASPDIVNVALGKTGKPSELTALLDALQQLRDSVDLVSVVTPEKTFLDYSLEAFDYQRSASAGVDRLLVSLRLVEVRQVSPDYTSEQIPAPKKASDKAGTNAGKQQPQDADEATRQRAARASRQSYADRLIFGRASADRG